ncbi:MAG: HEAT repeat domain-containing protein [Anaerolineae bacterium]
MRRGIIEAMKRIGDPRALPKLERVAREDTGKTPWGSVAEAARGAAERIRRRTISG